MKSKQLIFFRKRCINKKVITILAQNKIIPQKYQTELEGLASLRNILVHDYLAIDPNLLYQDLQSGLEAIEVFIREVEQKFGKTIGNTKKMKE